MADAQWLDGDEAAAWRGYLRLNAVLMAELNRELQRDSGLSGSDYDVLVMLSEKPQHRLRMHELGTQLLWEKSRLSHHITRMERRGLVRREECDVDGRGAFVAITTAGMTAIRNAAPAHVANVRRHVFDHLDRDDVRALARITTTLLAGLDRVEESAATG